MKELDGIIRRSLSSFVTDLRDRSWRVQREREAVSQYVFGHLLKEIRDGGWLSDSAQISIEYPVPQLPSEQAKKISGRRGSKGQVCKDVVLWPKPRTTCWDELGNPTVAPSAILEWKFGKSGIYEPDAKWLEDFSVIYPGFVGYAVAVNRPGAEFLLMCMRVSGGVREPDWLHI